MTMITPECLTNLIVYRPIIAACFSIPFTTLPSISLNGLNAILNTSTVSRSHYVWGLNVILAHVPVQLRLWC